MTESTKVKGGFRKVFGFFADSWTEMKKVRWPSRKEMISYTLVVLVTVVLVSVYFGLLDAGLSALVRLF